MKPPNPTSNVPFSALLPPEMTAGVADPRANWRRACLLDRAQLDIARALAEFRRVVELRTAMEHDVHRDMVGPDLDDPALVRQSLERVLPLDRVLQALELFADDRVPALADRLHRRHHRPQPLCDFPMALFRPPP